MGKIKNTASRRPHAVRTLICDIIVLLKLRHHVASRRIQDFLEAFFMFFLYKMWYLVVSKKKNPLLVWGWDRKIHHLWSLFVITPQASWCQSLILWMNFFYRTLMIDGFFYLSLMIDYYCLMQHCKAYRHITDHMIIECFASINGSR